MQIVSNPYKENSSIIGAAQVGKTEWCKKVCAMLNQAGFNVVVYAPHPNWIEVSPASVKRTISSIVGTGLEIYYPVENSIKDFDFFMQTCYQFQNQVVIMDELHNFCKKQSWPNSLELFCRNCNNRNMGYIAIFQAPAEVPGFVLRNSMHKYCFYLDLPTDIDYMKKWLGPKVEEFNQGWPIESRDGFYKKQGLPVERFSAK